MSVIIQKIKKREKSAIDVAIKYYSIICLVNNIKLTKKQVELLAFTSVRGTISSLSAKEEFCSMFGSSIPSINNMISELKEIGFLEKFHKKYRVRNELNLNFLQRDIVLEISLIKE